ncbi:MAG TPA: TolC family protein, partial [Candidatus Polarisedimenticolaceae bacterium]|nr:TolC family protein [Candidatus Polarisedimenticolaceae bacterium]
MIDPGPRWPRLALILSALLATALDPASASDPATFEAPVKPPPPDEPPRPQVVEPEAPLTLYDAIALTRMEDPELQDAAWAGRAAEARAAQAKKVPNPEVDLRMWRLDGEARNEPDDLDRYRVIVSKEVEFGGRRRWRTDQARAEQEVAGWEFAAKRDEVSGEVTIRFVEVLGAQRRVEVYRELGAFHEQLERTVAKLVETGSLRPVEIHQLRRRAGLARIDLARAEAELDASRMDLTLSWGNAAPRFTEAIGDLDRVPALPDRETVLALAEASPTAESWQARLDAGRAAISLAKSNAVPDVQLGVGARWLNEMNETDYMLDLEIELPIFDR